MKRIMRRITGRCIPRGRSRGQILIEVLIALVLFGLIGTTFAGALYTSLQAARVADQQATALTLAKSELEFVKQRPFATDEWGYVVDSSGAGALDGWALPSWWGDSQPSALSSDDFAGYSVQVTSEEVDLDNSGAADEGIRKLTATAFYNGEEIQTLENYEVDR
ncbi:MAG: type IV pilus modification PilV family protein [Chloroflexota bacterium]